jgi:MoaA/NifB/PqqE/SkfB family radical SAM enzyme
MGEPLSHPKVFEWISDIRKKDCDIGIVLNPPSLNDEIPSNLIESRPNSITISFPSLQKDVFKKLCPIIPFEDALKRTLELVNLSRRKVGLRIASITTDINSDERKEHAGF